MSTSGIGCTSGAINAITRCAGTRSDPIQPAAGVSGVTRRSQAALPTGYTTETASLPISRPGELLSKLHQLKTQDPTKFKQLLSDVASRLRAQSQQDQGDHELSRLADNVQRAADTGDLTALQPRSHPRTGGPEAAYAPVSSQDFHVAHDALTGQENPLTPVVGASPFSSLLAILNRALAG
jgi:hypothetical protein